jgi:oxygen-dependent protoporphyrinogen oxidase
MVSDATVVGGGVAGLVVARRLALAGASVTVLERSDAFGGQVAALPIGGVVLDAAAESFATRGGAVAALADELGLGDDVVAPSSSPAWLHRRDGSAVPLPVTGIMGIPGRPLAADVVRAIGLPGAWRAALDGLLPRRVGADASSIGDLVRARMGPAVVDGLVAPVVRGVHSTDPYALPVDAVSPRLRSALASSGSLATAVRTLRAQAPAGTQVAGIRGGMHRLVDALVADCGRLGVDLRTGASGSVVPRGLVVRAHSEPGAGSRTLTIVTLVVRAGALDAAPRGTGLLVAADAPGVAARALTHLTSKWAWIGEAMPGRHALRLSYDGAPSDAVATARADAEILLGATIERVDDAATRRWRRGATGAAVAAQPAVGETVAGTGLAAVVAHAERTAAELIAGHPPRPVRERMER